MDQFIVFSLNVTIANLSQDWERASGGRDGKNMFCASFGGGRVEHVLRELREGQGEVQC